MRESPGLRSTQQVEEPADRVGAVVDDENINARVVSEQAQALFASYNESSIAGLVLGLGTGGVIYWLWPSTPILLWCALVTAYRVLMPFQSISFRQDHSAHSAARAQRWLRRHARGMRAYSAIWGLLPWVVPESSGFNGTALVLIMMLGMINGGAPSMTASMASVYAFVVPMAVGLVSNLFWQGTVLSSFLAVASLINIGVTLKYAKLRYAATLDLLRTRFEKETLAERLAEQMRLVQQASEEKTRFLASASHDLRQPLHAMALFGAVLERELVGHEQYDSVRHQMSALRALTDSLDAMLDISQIDGGTIRAEPQPVDLQTLMQSLRDLFSARAEKKGLQLRLRFSPLWVRSDPALLLRILANLVDNAIKYTERGGVLVVARERGDLVWLEVVDTGVGIAPEHQARIYDEYYQIDNPGRDRSKGLGVGLSIVRRLSALLAHPLSLKSRPGRGSRFRLQLPLAAQALKSLNEGAATPVAGGPLLRLPQRVLLIDDDTHIAAAMGALMRSYRIQLVHAPDESRAREAMAWAQRRGEPFEVILCDMRLANGADGLALAQALQQEAPPEAPWQTLLITGETAPEALQRIRATGLRVLFKPVNAESLLQALELPQR